MSLYAAIKRALKDVLSNILDTPVSTRASEATLQSVLSQLDITLVELRDAITAAPPNNKTLADLYERLDSIRSQIDTAISTRASEETLASVLGQLDLTLTELRDAIRGTGDKTLTDLDTSILNLLNALKPTRTLPIKEISSQTITGGNYAEFTVDNSEADGFSALVITTKAAYNSGASSGVRVRWLYSPDGTNFDTPEDAEAAGNYDDLSFAAGQTRTKTTLIPLFQPYVKVQIVNLDPVYDVVVDVWRVLMR